MLSSLGKFALAFIIAFTIINTMVQVDLMSVGYQQILIVGALLVGAMLQAMAWLYLLEVLAQFFFPV